MSREVFPATWEGGHALIVESGDEELIGHCQCGAWIGTFKPDQPIDSLCVRWERHVMSPELIALRLGKTSP